MGRILAFDFGLKRIGMAVTDPLKIIATGLETIETKEIWDYLKKYTSKEIVEAFVVGYPMQMNNTPSEIQKDVDEFITNLNKNFPGIPIHKIDERFTSKMASQSMFQGGLKKHDRQNKALIDKVSATIILQSFMAMKS